MIDKVWLNKIDVAYKEYTKRVGPSLDIENFIKWLYNQYGVVPPVKKD